MKYLKSFKKFNEDANVNASNVSGMGAVVNPTVSDLPGVVGESGSGDVSNYIPTKKKRKKGKPSDVTDLRDLENADVVRLTESVDKYKKYFNSFEDLGYSEVQKIIQTPDSEYKLGLFMYKYHLDRWSKNTQIKIKFDKNGIFDRMGNESFFERNEYEIEYLEMYIPRIMDRFDYKECIVYITEGIFDSDFEGDLDRIKTTIRIHFF